MVVTLQDDRPHYHALSYEWGSDGVSETVYIDDLELQVTKNLLDALVEFQREVDKDATPDGPHYIWVDAVCINQSELAGSTLVPLRSSG